MLDDAKNSKYINELQEIGKGQCEEAKEIKFLLDVISDIIDQLSGIGFFIPDLRTDCCMGLLYIDENRNVIPDAEMEQAWGWRDEEDKKEVLESANHKRILNAQKHYPYAQYEDERFPVDGIPGGCEEYHKLMMSKENISIFATNIDKENKNTSFEKYGFPRAHNIYEKLKNTSIENMLLLEKTLGIGYTNQLFCYVREFKDIHQLNKIEGVIIPCLEIPMFSRKYITNKLLGYLKSFEYSELSIQYAEQAIRLIADLLRETYGALLEISWWVYYWTYCNGETGNEDKDLRDYWEQYFNEETAYGCIIRNEIIHD